jgi:hypothetical protein
VFSFLLFVSESFVSLFEEGKLNTLLWQKRDDGFLALSNNEDVVDSGSEGVTLCVLDVSNIEA